MGSLLRQTLNRLCCSNGWSYGAFWGFDQRNPMLLTMEDAYYEEEMKTLVDDMLQKFHIFGEGIIGEAAFSRRNRWIFLDSHGGDWSSTGSVANENVLQDESEFQSQFSSGIKTIAIISLESQGVVQFGSTQKILERLEFLDQTKRLFNDMGSMDRLILADTVPSSLNNENYDLDGFFPSLLSAGNSSDGNLKSELGGCSGELTGKPYSPRMDPVPQNSSHRHGQLQTICVEALKTQQQSYLLPFSSVNNSAADTPCSSSWAGEGSVLTSFETLMPSNEGLWDSPLASPPTNSPVLWDSSGQTHGCSTSNSFCRTGAVDLQYPIEDSSRNLIDSQNSAASILLTDGLLGSVTSLPRIAEEFMPAEYSSDISNFCAVDDLARWFAVSPAQDTNAARTAITGDLSCAMEVSSVSSGLVGGDVLDDIPVNYPANSVQSSITDAFQSNVQKKSTVVQGTETDLFDSLKYDFGSGKTGECLGDLIMPVISGNYPAVGTRMPGCISRPDVGCTAGGSHAGLFSKLGLEELLNTFSSSESVTNSTVKDQVSTTKRRKMEGSYSTFNPVDFVGLPYSSGSINLMQQSHKLDRANSNIFKNEVPPKSQVGLWIDDSYSINVVDDAVGALKKSEEPSKVTKKRAKPGQSTRARPKDRQMIQDRLRELRGIIPDSGKCSIDSLLDRTVKYMCFLQGVTKYADKLTQADEPKLTGPDRGTLLKDNKGGSSGGATWAFEVGDRTMGCPVIVEDLNPPGQMLIEMLCEDRGFFLEIADIIRGFGLNILKGVMEIREDKIWAHFIVEANKQVTRLDILWSLIQLLQQTPSNGINPSEQPSSTVDCVSPLLNNHQQPLLPPSVRLAETRG